MRAFSIEKFMKRKMFIILNFYSKKKYEKRMFKHYDRTGRKGVLIRGLIEYMFNDIWPIYNVLKI